MVTFAKLTTTPKSSNPWWQRLILLNFLVVFRLSAVSSGRPGFYLYAIDRIVRTSCYLVPNQISCIRCQMSSAQRPKGLRSLVNTRMTCVQRPTIPTFLPNVDLPLSGVSAVLEVAASKVLRCIFQIASGSEVIVVL
ncbi:hypothetical protein F5J12DRAFT_838754 [Pisolithus orientalis]|uniref:uncharacterized protein n=1 Tax=Pisolithus orientalis TaxID=936130 RepID=UPI002224837D|nr:uncharacterized protein F5J12DRAFT_838754 [Pisolithus orientalis]KAI6003178.1 hypothetical protein F5J12DRAFT_838754 [Pisolithus orientalis]